MSAPRAGTGQQELLGAAPEAGRALLCALTPGGRIRLHMVLAEGGTELDATLGFWRDLGRQFVGAVCGALDPTDPHSFVLPEPDHEALCSLAAAVPPMRGAELVSGELLAEVWTDMGEALAAEAHERKTGIQGYLEAHHSLWNVVGRVCFHLAENKRDLDYPFAFIATYARQISQQAKLQYVPLGRALREYAGAEEQSKPVRRRRGTGSKKDSDKKISRRKVSREKGSRKKVSRKKAAAGTKAAKSAVKKKATTAPAKKRTSRKQPADDESVGRAVPNKR